jgi:hypothetical protein
MLPASADLPYARASTHAGEQSHPRKLLQQQYRPRNRGGGFRDPNNRADQQIARNQVAQINTQYAIRNAVESGANPRAVQGAAYTGQANAWLAAQGSDLVWAPWVGKRRSSA